MHTNLREQLDADQVARQSAAFDFMHAALYGKTSTVAEQAVAAMDIGAGPATTDLVHILIAAARGAKVADQALALLGRIAVQHATYNAGV